MKHLAYPKYKSSGINWIGDIPEGWTIDRIKASVKSCNNGIWGDEPAGDNNDTICIRVADFNRDNLSIDISDPTLRNISAREKSNRTLRKGDLLVEKSGGGENQPVGCVVLYNYDTPAVCSNFIAKMSLKDGMNPAFWKYLHAAAYSIRLTVGSINQTSGIQNLDHDRYFDEKVSFPSLEEQQKIANFLDRETVKIDELIQKQEKLVELLIEKRASYIEKVITKGLNSNVKFKDSDILWIGEIPDKWTVKKLKFLADITTGDKDTVDADENGEYPFFVRSQTIEKIGTFTYDCEAVLTAGDGAGVGKVFHYVSGKFDFHQRVYMISNFRGIKGKFFFYYLSSLFAKVALDGGAKSTVDSLRRHQFTNFPITVPSLDEQDVIIEHIETFSWRIDSLMERSKTSIDLLKEHRASLISAAVTGKIDVRELV